MKEFVVTKVTSEIDENLAVVYKSNTTIECEKNIHEVFVRAMCIDKGVKICYARPTNEYLTTCFIVTEMKYIDSIDHYLVDTAGVKYADSADEVIRHYDWYTRHSSVPKIVFIRPATREEAGYYEDTFCDIYD